MNNLASCSDFTFRIKTLKKLNARKTTMNVKPEMIIVAGNSHPELAELIARYF